MALEVNFAQYFDEPVVPTFGAGPLRRFPLEASLFVVGPGKVPLRAVPLRAVPLRAVPLRAVPLAAGLAGYSP